ncbi:MAG: hypothetical protein MJ169_09335 [Treponema sp.]|nr:hypothetical protein [Treponema sp.]
MNLYQRIYFISILVCAIVFLAISFYAFLSKNPINFWAGEKISASQVTDVKKYNQANGKMWIIYGICWLIAAIIGLFNIRISAIVVVVFCVGVVILILVNKKIRKQYFKI